jgi:tetratricopeptide (TPR) repeat protein
MKITLYLFLFVPFFVLAQSNFGKGVALYNEKKYDEAEVVFQSVVRANPSNLKAMEYLGDIAGQNKSWEKALTYYEKLKVLRPSEADYHFKYGGALGMKALTVNKFKALGMIDDIKGSFEQAIVLDSKHVPARWALIELYLQLPGIVGGSESKALQYSSELQKLSPVDGYMSRGHIDEYFKRYSKAEEQYKKAIALGNSNNSYRLLASLYKNKMKQPAKAAAVLESMKNK